MEQVNRWTGQACARSLVRARLGTLPELRGRAEDFATILETRVIERVLSHLTWAACPSPPRAPARAPMN